MHSLSLALLGGVLGVGAVAHAEDGRELAPPTTTAPARTPVELAVGVEAGGAAFLRAPSGPIANTTATTSAAVFARGSLALLASRTLEVAYVPRHGAGVMLFGGDLELGRFHLHLLDLGVFYAIESPITVARVTRRWDATLGAGLETAVGDHLRVVVDARLFAPADLWGVVTHYGDTARLIGREVVEGVQLWAGASWRW